MTKSPKRTEIEREKWELPIRSATLGYLGGLNRKSTDVANGTKLTEGVGVVVKSGFAVREQLRENRPTLAGTTSEKGFLKLNMINLYSTQTDVNFVHGEFRKR